MGPRHDLRTTAAALACALAVGCGGGSANGASAAVAEEPGGPLVTPQGDLVGEIGRDAIEQANPAWAEARASARPDLDASHALAAVEPGARIDIFLGTWCGDSRREVTRLWTAFDEAGVLPFEVRYVGVDRAKVAPNGLTDGVDLEYVPTIIVYRDDREVGRIVESAPGGVEVALLALLRGERTGTISGRDL